MSNPEKSFSYEAETDLAMLRAELADLLRTHADKIGIRVADDLAQLTNIVLAGTYQEHSGTENRDKIRIWHRLHNSQNDYLVTMGTGDDVHWAHINDTEAHWVWHNKPQLTKEDIQKIQWRIQPDIAEWDANDSETAANIDNIFGYLGYYDKQ